MTRDELKAKYCIDEIVVTKDPRFMDSFWIRYVIKTSQGNETIEAQTIKAETKHDALKKIEQYAKKKGAKVVKILQVQVEKNKNLAAQKIIGAKKGQSARKFFGERK